MTRFWTHAKISFLRVAHSFFAKFDEPHKPTITTNTMGRTPLFNEAVRSNIPQTIEGEPPFLAVPFGSLKMIKSIVVLILFASVVWPLSCLVFPLFVVGVVVYGYPPHIPNLREGVRLVKAIWATKYGIKTYQRFVVIIIINDFDYYFFFLTSSNNHKQNLVDLPSPPQISLDSPFFLFLVFG